MVERLTKREYGPSLTVRYASRFDQIHFKLHATVDRGGGKHFAEVVVHGRDGRVRSSEVVT